MRRRRRAGWLGVLALGLSVQAGAVRAQGWGPPEPAFARYGLRTIVCDARTHDAPCLGLACRDGALALVNAAGGGGPMDGPTRVSTGKTTFTMNFRYDTRAVDRLGVAASEADLTMGQFEALVGADAVTLTAQSDPRIRHRFTARGLAQAWERAAQACG